MSRGEGLRRAGRSLSALAAGEALNKATRFAAAVLLARALDLAEFGLVNVGIALSGVLLSLTALGLPEFGARELAVNPGQVRHVAGLVLVTRLAALAVVTSVAVTAAALVTPGQVRVVLLAALMAVGLSASADWVLRGREQMTDAAGATAFGGIVVLAGCASIVLLRPTVTVALIVFAAGEAATAGATWWRARAGRPAVPSTAEIRGALRVAWPLGVSGLIIYASYANLDTIVLAAVRSEAEAGLYSAPYRMFLAASAVSIFAAYSLLPMIARTHQDGRTQDGRRLLLRAFLPLAGYGLLVLATAEVVGGRLMSGLFGPEFAHTRAIFIVLCVAVPWNAVGLPAGYALIGEQRNRDFLRGAAVAGALNVLLMALLIPGYGADGAAIATTGALVGGALVWMLLAGVLRRAAILCSALAVASFGGALAARSPGLSVPIGLVTGVIGLATIGAPSVRRRTR